METKNVKLINELGKFVMRDLSYNKEHGCHVSEQAIEAAKIVLSYDGCDIGDSDGHDISDCDISDIPTVILCEELGRRIGVKMVDIEPYKVKDIGPIIEGPVTAYIV